MPFSSLLSALTTLHFVFKNFFTKADPIEPEAPVIKIVLSLKLFFIII